MCDFDIVTQGAVSQWLNRAQVGGIDTLRRRKAPGPKSRLTAVQWEQTPELLKRGAEAFGFRGDMWTHKRVAEVIRREFGISYHPSDFGRPLRQLGWSQQKPIRQAIQRDEETIRYWQNEHWPKFKKRRSRRPGSGLCG